MQVVQVYDIRVNAPDMGDQLLCSSFGSKCMRVKYPCLQPVQLLVECVADLNGLRLARSSCPAMCNIAGMASRNQGLAYLFGNAAGTACIERGIYLQHFHKQAGDIK